MNTSRRSWLKRGGFAALGSGLLSRVEKVAAAAATHDRLSLEWNKATVKRFEDRLAERDIHAFLARDPLNVTYLTGYWHTTTERPQAVFMNRDDADSWFLYPGLDRDIVTSWWFGGGRMYFDLSTARNGAG